MLEKFNFQLRYCDLHQGYINYYEYPCLHNQHQSRRSLTLSTFPGSCLGRPVRLCGESGIYRGQASPKPRRNSVTSAAVHLATFGVGFSAPCRPTLIIVCS
ncbi:hypothetical protein J6590_055144 [Homalodisca vitripennis]|nr:hypothetical protein J6590_055144 [Homalodisca vitripennis]